MPASQTANQPVGQQDSQSGNQTCRHAARQPATQSCVPAGQPTSQPATIGVQKPTSTCCRKRDNDQRCAVEAAVRAVLRAHPGLESKEDLEGDQETMDLLLQGVAGLECLAEDDAPRRTQRIASALREICSIRYTCNLSAGGLHVACRHLHDRQDARVTVHVPLTGCRMHHPASQPDRMPVRQHSCQWSVV